MYGIKLIGLGSGNMLVEPEWVTKFDPDIHEIGKPYPTGMVESSIHAKEAMRFETFEAAHALWNTQSETVPYRPDGRPNKPMTAFTVEIVKLPEE